MNKKNNEEKNSLIIVIWSDFPFNTVCLSLLEVEQIISLWIEVSDSYMSLSAHLEKALSLSWDPVAGHRIGKALSTFSQETWSRENLLCESHYFLNPNHCLHTPRNSVLVGSKAGWGPLVPKAFQDLPGTLHHAQREDDRSWARERLPLPHGPLGSKSFLIRTPGKSEHCSDIPVRLFQTWHTLLNVEYALFFFLFPHDLSIIIRVLGKEAFSLTGNKFIRYYLVFDQSALVAQLQLRSLLPILPQQVPL